MSAGTLRLIGILFLLSAAVLMILNLKRVADMGTFWVGLPLLLIGVILVARSRKAG
jgi:hypothetical protein